MVQNCLLACFLLLITACHTAHGVPVPFLEPFLASTFPNYNQRNWTAQLVQLISESRSTNNITSMSISDDNSNSSSSTISLINATTLISNFADVEGWSDLRLSDLKHLTEQSLDALSLTQLFRALELTVEAAEPTPTEVPSSSLQIPSSYAENGTASSLTESVDSEFANVSSVDSYNSSSSLLVNDIANINQSSFAVDQFRVLPLASPPTSAARRTLPGGLPGGNGLSGLLKSIDFSALEQVCRERAGLAHASGIFNGLAAGGKNGPAIGQALTSQIGGISATSILCKNLGRLGDPGSIFTDFGGFFSDVIPGMKG